MKSGPVSIARIYPAPFPELLHWAGMRRDTVEINRLVDELHKRGFCEARCKSDPLKGGLLHIDGGGH